VVLACEKCRLDPWCQKPDHDGSADNNDGDQFGLMGNQAAAFDNTRCGT
jgi:hypothetical protein